MPADRFITVVSGLPRSGTSLMMNMLKAGGMPLLTDETRPADDGNPNGYYEFEPVRRSADDTSWVPLARGKAVKIVHALLKYLPADERYCVILMKRNVDEVIASQQAMIARLASVGASLSSEELASGYCRQLNEITDWLSEQTNIRYTIVSYNQLLIDPQPELERIAVLLDRPLDSTAMATVVDPALYRQRGNRTE
jgi:hypothetical protein